MTLLIMFILIYQFKLSPFLYPVAFLIWLPHLVLHTLAYWELALRHQKDESLGYRLERIDVSIGRLKKLILKHAGEH